MKKFILLLTVSQFMLTLTFAQHALLSQAEAFYNKKEFGKAFAAYETYYADTTKGKSNFDTYHAAIAACNIGKQADAKKYLGIAIQIGFHQAYYQQLSTDPFSTCIKGFKEWKKLMAGLKLRNDSSEHILSPIRRNLFDTCLRINATALSDGSFLGSLKNSNNPAKAIKDYKVFPAPKKTGYWTLYTVKVDTLEVPFLLYIPSRYDGKSRIPLNVFLHGAVSGKAAFYQDPALTVENQRVLLGKQLQQNSFIIWPYARGSFNWLRHQSAFDAILLQITKVKSLYNIDDDRVYLGGHSDGGAGAFWFALNKPSTFAGIFALNYFPQIVTGGNTTLNNFRNVMPFFGVNGIDDSGMPLSYIDPIYDLARANGANWTNYSIRGDHNLPYDVPDSLTFLYEKLFLLRRDPFAKKLEWQADDIRNGRNAWIAISELDTLKEKAGWHLELNPTITQNAKPVVLNYNRKKSGAIIAEVNGNNITIQASRVKKITLYISAEMFDLDSQIQVTINGQPFSLKVKTDPKVMTEEFLKTGDRVFLVANKVELTIGQ